jgi:serine/threonine protein kinase/tetratricopeptide (TPR) repeat protein
MEPEPPRLDEEATDPSTFSARASGDTERQTEILSPAELDDLRQTRLLASSARGFALGPAAPSARPLPQLEGYEILHLLGRGGMGVVYKARQVRLDRVVALKMIRADLGAGEEERARFQTEAEAAARLQHSNIVQVYEVGGLAGVPYIALEFVGGGSLADHLNGTPLPPRQAAALVETLARAVHHAHERGVVHRDLKPANILLAVARGPLAVVPEAETPRADDKPRPTNYGVPKITDFGLAKCLGAGAGRHTRPGEILGTPSYMAPEQASGKGEPCRPACDVYSLGAILYELLTGRPPFVGPTPMEAAVQVLNEEPVPPRRLLPTVPRDLETVCLQCLQKDPLHRYASAHELAEDCAAFLRGEPVRARPASVWERGLKWARRRPASAGLIAVTTLALLVLLLGAWWYNALLRAERDEAERQRHDALEARRQAERNEGEARRQREAALAQEKRAERQRDKARAWFRQARAAVDTMLTRVGEQTAPLTPQTAAVRRRLLEDALGFYQGFLKEAGDDPVIRAETARAYLRVGDIYRTMGEPKRSAEAYRRGADVQEKLTRDFPEAPAYAHDLGELYHNLGLALFALGQEPAAEKAHRRGVEVLEGLTKRFPDNLAYRRGLARQWCGLGGLLLRSGRWDGAEAASRRSLRLLERLAKETPDDTCRQMLAVSRSNLSTVLARKNNYEDAEVYGRQSVELHRQLVETSPTLKRRQDLGHALGNWGRALQGLKRRDEAVNVAREALAVRRKLAAEFPRLAACRVELADSLSSLGVLLAEARSPEAEPLHREAVALRRKLVADFPLMADYRSELGASLHNLALARRAHPAEALDLTRQAIMHQRAALAVNPRHDVYRSFLRNHFWMLAELQLARGEHAEAAAAARDMADVFPEYAEDRYRAARLLTGCVPLAAKDAKHDDAQRRRLAETYAAQAVDHLREALRLGHGEPARLRDDPVFAPLRQRPDFKALFSRVQAQI